MKDYNKNIMAINHIENIQKVFDSLRNRVWNSDLSYTESKPKGFRFIVFNYSIGSNFIKKNSTTSKNEFKHDYNPMIARLIFSKNTLFVIKSILLNH